MNKKFFGVMVVGMSLATLAGCSPKVKEADKQVVSTASVAEKEKQDKFYEGSWKLDSASVKDAKYNLDEFKTFLGDEAFNKMIISFKIEKDKFTMYKGGEVVDTDTYKVKNNILTLDNDKTYDFELDKKNDNIVITDGEVKLYFKKATTENKVETTDKKGE